MRILFISTLLMFVSVILLAPYFVGRIQLTNVERTVQNFGNESNEDFETDGEIENILRVYDFNIGWRDKPTFIDYYRSGFEAIKLELN